MRKQQIPWNKGAGGCNRGHDPSRYQLQRSGVSVCLDCKRENAAKYRDTHRQRITWTRRARVYGLTVADLDSIFNRQRGKCAICPFIFSDGNYHIDHDHKTGKVRGLLCSACNTGIGLFKDSPLLLVRAMEYINGRVSSAITPAASSAVRVHYVESSETYH